MVQMDLTVQVIEKYGTTEQKEEFLRPAVSGDKVTALAISEPDCGSDVAAMQTRATLDRGDWVIRGQKLWITNGGIADFLVLAVRTGEHRHHGISLVLFPTSTPGFTANSGIEKVGNVASNTTHLFFDDCRVPARLVLGEPDHGFSIIMENFQGERLATTLLVLSFMDRALWLSMQYARERKAFGHALMENQIWRHRFAEHRAQVEATRWLTYRALDVFNRTGRATKEIAMAKLATCDLAQKVLYDCTQVFGGFGYTLEYPVARMWRDLRLYTIGAGTSEIMKEIIAKEEGFLAPAHRQ
jgi:citronellyl-CoA dehydrogenase